MYSLSTMFEAEFSSFSVNVSVAIESLVKVPGLDAVTAGAANTLIDNTNTSITNPTNL